MLQIVVVSALSVALSLTSVWLFGTAGPKPGIVVVSAGIATFLLSYIVPTIVVFLVLYRALQERMPRKTQVRVIVSSYGCMIAVFTGVYFSMQFAGDYEYAADHYFYYKYGGQDLARGRIQRLNSYPDTTLAFTGIKKRLWGTVDDYLPRGIYRDLEDIERYRGDWASRAGFRDVVRFRRDAVWPVVVRLPPPQRHHDHDGRIRQHRADHVVRETRVLTYLTHMPRGRRLAECPISRSRTRSGGGGSMPHASATPRLAHGAGLGM